MCYLIGIDEAGYAPNLGPLVIAASVWRVADWTPGDCLYKRLRGVVSKRAARRVAERATAAVAAGEAASAKKPARRKPAPMAIGDSKAIYSTQIGIGPLERSVLAALALTGLEPRDWHAAWRDINRDTVGEFDRQPWHADYAANLPLAADGDEIVKLVPHVRKSFERAGVELLTLRSTAVFPAYFNDCNDEFGNKGETLSKLTLRLLAEMLELCGEEPVEVVCDRHGGRARYGRLLQQQFPDPLIEIRGESPTESSYEWGPAERRLTVHFRVGGESYLPVALASMTAKYLRELAMRAFNEFWLARVPDLRPTAGYPGDSRRFKNAIDPQLAELGISERAIWRPR